MKTEVQIDASEINSQERYDKLMQTEEEMELIINSKNFKDKVIALNPWGETSKLKKLRGIDLYNRIMSGYEDLDPEEDRIIEIYVKTYFAWNSVVGYTYPNVRTVYMNTRFFDTNSTKYIGSNALHEYSHKVGFNHDFRSTSARPNSVSYLLNLVYESCYDEIILKKEPKKWEYICRRKWFFFKKCYWVEI